MPRSTRIEPTDRELEILHLLWEGKEMTLGDIWEQLRRQREVAKTTVATVLSVMRDKGLVRRTAAARSPFWSAAVSRCATGTSMVQGLLDKMFEGSAARMVSHVLEAGEPNAEQLRQIRRLIEEHRKKSPEAHAD